MIILHSVLKSISMEQKYSYMLRFCYHTSLFELFKKFTPKAWKLIEYLKVQGHENKKVPFHIISTQNGMIKTHWACLNSLYSWVPNKRVECKKVQVGWRINTFLSLCRPFCMLPYLHFFHPTRLFGTREYSNFLLLMTVFVRW